MSGTKKQNPNPLQLTEPRLSMGFHTKKLRHRQARSATTHSGRQAPEPGGFSFRSLLTFGFSIDRRGGNRGLSR